jgi:protoporphyrinogen oxidase
VQLAKDAIWPALGIREPPARAWVARWPRALPRYAPDHEESLRTLARLLDGGPPLELAGAAYRASGIAGALESARAVARGLVVESA